MSRILSRRDGWTARLPLAALLALALGGCASTVADLPVVGLPANTPSRPVVAGEYPAVHDVPPRRAEATLTPEQVDQAEKELVAVRNRQAFGAQKPTRKKPSGSAKAPSSPN